MRSCEALREEFSALLDGELEPFRRTEIEEHLSECSECLRVLGGMKKVDDLYRALLPAAAPADFEERLKQRLQPGGRFFTARKITLRRIWLIAAAAGLLAVLSVFFMRMQAPSPEHMHLTRAQEEPAIAPKALMGEPDMTHPPPVPLAVAEPFTTADTYAEALPEASVETPPSPLRAEMPPSKAAGDGVAMNDALGPRAPGALRSMREPPARQVGDRVFVLSEGVWREQGYADEPVTPLLRDSEEFRALCTRHDDLPAIAALGPTVILRLEEIWRRIEAAADEAGH